MLMSSLIVAQGLVPLIGQGSCRMDIVAVVCSRVLEKLVKFPSCSTLMAAAIDEVRLICQFLQYLVAKDGSAADMTVVNTVMSAKTGSKYLIKQCVMQNRAYKEAELSMKEADQASRMLGPQVAAALETMKAPTWEALTEILNQFPRWCDALRPGMQLFERLDCL